MISSLLCVEEGGRWSAGCVRSKHHGRSLGGIRNTVLLKFQRYAVKGFISATPVSPVPENTQRRYIEAPPTQISLFRLPPLVSWPSAVYYSETSSRACTAAPFLYTNRVGTADALGLVDVFAAAAVGEMICLLLCTLIGNNVSFLVGSCWRVTNHECY